MLEKTWRGITFRLSLLFPAAVIVLMSFDNSNFILLCLFASFLHEAGHALAMLIVRDRPSRVTVGIFGICVERDRGYYLGYRSQALVSLAGPVVNVFCFTLFWCLHQPIAAAIHAGLALFNLLPVSSLDGGEALYALLCAQMPEERAVRIARAVSLAVIFPLAVVGFWLLLSETHNFSLLVMSGYLLLLLFFKEKH
ncbi:MAG: peptidase M50 [Clostridia bacterium]|nr:peptidase M50 [Clostridia bacterium]